MPNGGSNNIRLLSIPDSKDLALQSSVAEKNSLATQLVVEEKSSLLYQAQAVGEPTMMQLLCRQPCCQHLGSCWGLQKSTAMQVICPQQCSSSHLQRCILLGSCWGLWESTLMQLLWPQLRPPSACSAAPCWAAAGQLLGPLLWRPPSSLAWGS